MEEDKAVQGKCICGKENLRYLFAIKNILNGSYLFPIGSKCIKKFKRKDLDLIVKRSLEWNDFKNKIQYGKYISLNDLSRDLILVFRGKHYLNDADYNFLLKMFNRHKQLTSMQNRKTNALLFKIKNNVAKEILKKEKLL